MQTKAAEKKTDLLVYSLMSDAGLEPEAEKTSIREVQNALRTASKRLTGRSGRPEYIAVSGNFLLIVEDKKDTKFQASYMQDKDDTLLMDPKSVADYAENGALHYAQHVASLTSFKKIFAFGCSGTDAAHLIIRPIYVNDKTYKVLKPVKNFMAFSHDSIDDYYHKEVLEGQTEAQLELTNILNRAKQLNEDLRIYGNVKEELKPFVVSAILLALCCSDFNSTQLTGGVGRNDEERLSDGEKIYRALKHHVCNEVEAMPQEKVDVLLSRFQFIRQDYNLSSVNSRLGKSPLKYFTEYIHSKVLSAIQNNTTDDVLGRFYGEFLHYTTGDGKGLGIVLTPSHITQLMTELVDVSYKDKVFDPTCGTAAFDIAAMNRMLVQIDDLSVSRARKTVLKKRVKKAQLHGVELNPDMFAIATTNMILRGDGKSNLQLCDFLKMPVEELRSSNFTVGLMNPPYSQAKKRETSHLSELKFIKHLLDGMADRGRVAVIVPQSVMAGSKSKEEKADKAAILAEHTLEGVITCNTQTFYPVNVNPAIAVFTAHQEHPARKRCKFFDFRDDGFKLVHHVGLLDDGSHKSKVKYLLDCWHEYIPEREIPLSFMVSSTVSADDEWLHSNFYFNDEPPSPEDLAKAMADYLSFEFKMIVSGMEYLFEPEAADDADEACEPLPVAAKLSAEGEKEAER